MSREAANTIVNHSVNETTAGPKGPREVNSNEPRSGE